MSKRAVEEDVSDVLQPSANAAVQGVLTEVSPMKKSKTCNYFDGELADGKSSMLLFGFDTGVRRKLAEFGESKQSVVLRNCEVKRSRKGTQLEILVTKRTEVQTSNKQFDVENDGLKKRREDGRLGRNRQPRAFSARICGGEGCTY